MLLHCLVLQHVGKNHCQLKIIRLYLSVVFLIMAIRNVHYSSDVVATTLISTPRTQLKKRNKSKDG